MQLIDSLRYENIGEGENFIFLLKIVDFCLKIFAYVI